MKVHHSCIPGGVGVRGPRPVRVRARKTRPASNLNYHAIYSRFSCTTLLGPLERGREASAASSRKWLAAALKRWRRVTPGNIRGSGEIEVADITSREGKKMGSHETARPPFACMHAMMQISPTSTVPKLYKSNVALKISLQNAEKRCYFWSRIILVEHTWLHHLLRTLVNIDQKKEKEEGKQEVSSQRCLSSGGCGFREERETPTWAKVTVSDPFWLLFKCQSR